MRAEVIFIDDWVVILLYLINIHIHQKLWLLGIVNFHFVYVFHHKEIFRIFLFKVDGIQSLKIRLVLCDAISVMIAGLKNIFRRIHKNFYICANLNFESYQSDVKFFVKDHTDVLKFEPLKQLSFDRNSVNLVFHARDVALEPVFFLLFRTDFIILLL